MKKFIEDFKSFAFRGSVLDMAVGVMIGGAISAIVSSLVSDIFMPIISLLTKGVDLNSLFIALGAGEYASIEAANAAGVATINYGIFITSIVDFFLMALCIFLFLRVLLRMKIRKADDKKPAARKCPYCCTEIDKAATRCPHCTSLLDDTAAEAHHDMA